MLRDHIRDRFGASVAEIVDACTDDEGFAKGTAVTPEEERNRWMERKQRDMLKALHIRPLKQSA